jgi:hypothetical protein
LRHHRVELRGFEPLTPSMRTRCATGLRYSPWNASQRSKYREFLPTGDGLMSLALGDCRPLAACHCAQLAAARLALRSSRWARTAGHSAAVIEYLAESLGWLSEASRCDRRTPSN